MLKKIIIILVLITINSQIFAAGGSVYSRFGVGDLYYSYSARDISLGGLGTSLIDRRYLNIVNPATWSKINTTKFAASLNSTVYFQSDNTDNAVYNLVRFLGFQIGFPLKEDLGIGFVIGTTPYSVVNYSVINNVSSDLLGNYQEKFEGSGGLSKLFFGASFRLPLNITVGATFDYYTGNLKYESSFIFDETSDLTNSVFQSSNLIRGIGTTLGLESPDISEIFGSDIIKNFRIGLSYELAGNLNSDTSLTIISYVGETEVISGNSKFALPKKLNAGISFNLLGKYLFLLNYLYQPWSNFDINSQTQQNLQNLSIFNIGFEYSQKFNKFANFWELVKYRGGLSYEESQYAIGGEGINKIGFHAVISFPLGLMNSVDIGFMYGIRSTSSSNSFKEQIFQTNISLNFGEIWFVRRDR